MQCASMEVQLTDSAEEISQLRAQVAMLEAELSAHEVGPGTMDGIGSATHETELSSLRADMQQRVQQISELRLQLQAALSASAEVCMLTLQVLIVNAEFVMRHMIWSIWDYNHGVLSCNICDAATTVEVLFEAWLNISCMTPVPAGLI